MVAFSHSLGCGMEMSGEPMALLRSTIDDMGERILDLMLRTASGERSKSERLGLGDHEFVPWQIGIMS